MFARERAERNRRHHLRGSGRELAGVGKTSVLAPAGARIGFGEEVRAFGGSRVGAVRTVEDDAFTLEPATGPKAGATQGFGVEGVAGVFLAEVDEDRLVGRAALLLEGALALGVVDGSAMETTVVHVHEFAGRLSRRFLRGIGLFGGVRGRGREGRERKGGQDHEGTCLGEHRGIGWGAWGSIRIEPDP